MIIQEYEPLIQYKNEYVDGLAPWLWIKTDSGAWEGPKQDWESSHKEKYYKYVTDFSLCVQAGGNQGMYPRLLSEKFGTVITFEPDPLNFHCLVNNCQKDSIIKINGALGNSHKMVKLKRGSMSNTGTHTIRDHGEITTIQFMIDDLALTSCGLIALDIEGYELYALQGAVKTIETFKPVIIVERLKQELTDFLSKFGYKHREHSGHADQVYSVG
jgi:FkbM family methyltransferase